MNSKLPFLALLFLCLFLNTSSNAQSTIELKVERAKLDNAQFQSVKLFEKPNGLTNAEKSAGFVSKATMLNIKEADLKAAFDAKSPSIQLSIPQHNKATLELELIKSDIFAEGFKVTTQTSPNTPVNYDAGVHYHGVVAGTSGRSLAAVSIFDNEIMAVIATEESGNMILGSMENQKDQYILYEERDMLVNSNFECGSDDPAIVKDLKKLQDIANVNAAENLSNCVKVYIECEHDMFLEKGGTQQTVDFMTGLFNVVALLYDNEQITTQISEVFVWNTPDSYPTNSTSNALTAFRSTRTSFNGDLAHLVSRGAPSNGGVAWVDALCTSYNYAYSWLNSNYSGFPTYSWSVEVFTHEMGHNLGSPHTHSCSWNGNNTAIDGCGPASGNSEGCNGPVPAKGTIMSYCHLVSGVGIDFNLGFGPQPGDLIRNEINNASCLSSCGPPCTLTVSATGTPVNGNTAGTATATASGGTTPYAFNWSNGATTASISGLPAGPYSVTVTDAGGCNAVANVLIDDITPCTSSDVTLTIVLDNYPQETSWDIKDANGTTVASSNGTYAGQSNGSTVSEDFCLIDGCYDFTIYDTYGDGICCGYGQGSYILTDGNGNNLASGGQFGSSEVTNFCLNTNPPATVDVSITGSNDVSCAGGSDGSATAQAANGSGSYSYDWSNGATTSTASNLSAGTYTVTATDDNTGATATASLTVSQPSALTLNVTGTNEVDGDNSGTATATASGGTPSYSYIWSNGGTTASLSNLSAGVYTVVVTDGNGCTISESVTIENIPGAGCTNVVINSNNFDGGWGIWNDGGSDCRRSRRDASYAFSGDRCVRLRDNTNTSVTTTDSFDASSYEDLTVEFTYIARSMDNSNEDFWLQISTDGGATYTQVEEWNRGDEFENNIREFDMVNIAGPFSSNTRLRFRCDASGNQDWVYLDDVIISGCTMSPLVAPTFTDLDEAVIEIDEEDEADEIVTFSLTKIFPNPASNELNINYTLSDNQTAQLSIIDYTGKVVYQQLLTDDQERAQVDVSRMINGYYFVQIVSEGEQKVEKFVIMR